MPQTREPIVDFLRECQVTILHVNRTSLLDPNARNVAEAEAMMTRDSEQPARDQNIRAIVDYFESGIKDKAEAVGLELEHTLVHSCGLPLTYGEEHGQRWILEQLGGSYSEKMETESGELIGLGRPGATVTLEPAAQLELSFGPFADLQEAKKCLDGFEGDLAQILDPLDIEVLTPGYNPVSKAFDLPLIPKKRYKFMNRYLGEISKYGICMMRGSASTQVSIDYVSVDDCIRKMRVANAAGPVLALICDNTPIFEDAIRPHNMMRTEIWKYCDPARCNTVPGIMDEGFTLEDYAQYILDTPAIVSIADGTEAYDMRTFGEIYATQPMLRKDVEHALSMFFTDVRLKTYIEIRPADAMTPECVVAYAALVKGLFMNDDSIRSLERIFKGVSAQDIAEAKDALMRDGYDAKVYGSPASEIADELISIASLALSDDELMLMEPLRALVASRKTLADIALTQLEDK